MYIYNVTANVEDSIHDEWLKWMKEEHIPDVMATNMFLSNSIFEVLVDHEQGCTYSIQYEFKDMETFKLYEQVYAPKLQADHKEKYGNQVLAFRTLLRREHNYQGDPRS